MTSKLKKCNAWIRENRHRIRPHELIKKLNRSLTGYYNYYAVTDNMKSVRIFCNIVSKQLFFWLNRRSQKKSYTWESFHALLKKVPIKQPRLKHCLYKSAK